MKGTTLPRLPAARTTARFRRGTLGLSCCLGLLATAGTASAQGLSAPLVGTSISGPATLDPAAVHWNPGMIGFFEKPAVLATGSLILGDVRYRRERRGTYQREDSLDFKMPISPASVDARKGGSAPEVRATPFAPSASVFGVLPLGQRVVAGFGMYAPYAAILDLDEDGAQRWQLTKATIATVYFTPSIAYRPTDDISIGAGVSYVLGYAELSKVQDFAALDDVGRGLARDPIRQPNDFGKNAPTGVRELSVMARRIDLTRAIAHAFTFNVGVAFRPAKDVRVGLAYQHSVAMSFNGKFRLDMNDPFFTQDLKSQGLAYAPVVEGDATLSFTLPRALLAGVQGDVGGGLTLGAQAAYTFWSQVDAFHVVAKSPGLAQPKLGLPDTTVVDLPRHWKNTIAVDGTARYKLGESASVFVLGGFHSSAVPDKTIDVASPDGDRIVAALGGSYSVSEKTMLLGDAKVQTILPRTVVGSDQDLGNGVYHLSIYTLSIHALFTL
jgi:long-chain fatty acid transport protein